jgi:DMSO reductase anchor subunit
LKDSESGAVSIDGTICIGCKYCTLICPYDAPRYNPQLGYTEKCDFCQDRLHQERKPACVELCPADALRIETYDSAENGVLMTTMPGFSETRTRPAVRIQGWIPTNHCVRTTARIDPEEVSDFTSSIPSKETPKTSLSAEWPLLIFTSIAALQVAFISAFVISGVQLNLFTMLASGLLNLALTTAHLGKKDKAYRANKNIANSWLSREVLLYGLFIGLATLVLYISAPRNLLGFVSLTIGIMLLISIDGIYAVVPLHRKPFLKGAEITLSALIYGFLLNNYILSALVLAGIRSIFFIVHSQTSFPVLARFRWTIVSLRLCLGMVFPMIIFIMAATNSMKLWLLVCIFLAEMVERLWFYLRLDVLTPNNQMARDFKKALA